MSSPETITSAYGVTPRVIMRHTDESDPRWSAFNPSIAKSPSGDYRMTIRSSNYVIPDDTGVTLLHFGAYIKTRTWFCHVDPETLEVSDLREVQFKLPSNIPQRRGVEDARLFWREDGWYFTAVIFEPPEIKYARLCLFKFDELSNTATFVEMLKAPRADRSEKNWMAPDHATPEFDYIYSPTQVYKDGEVHGIHMDMEASISADRYLSSIRGGSGLVLQPDGTYLAVVHDVHVKSSRQYNPSNFGIEVIYRRDYSHYFARYSATGQLTHLSAPFILKKPGIEYVAGMVESGDSLILSFGARDVFSGLVKLEKEAVVRSLQPVGT